jgi:hypothetical protein
MSYDSEALAALRGTVEARVEQCQRGDDEWDQNAVVLITPYLLFHVLDELKSIHKTLLEVEKFT